MTRDIHQIMRSGYVTRWHSNPDLAHIRETLAEHHARVAQLIFALHPTPSLELIDAALHHDCGELVVGDTPAPAKEDNVKLRHMLKDAEEDALYEMGLDFKLGVEDSAWLHFADKLAAVLHVAHVRPWVLNRSDWRLMIHNSVNEASHLGCLNEAWLLLTDAGIHC